MAARARFSLSPFYFFLLNAFLYLPLLLLVIFSFNDSTSLVFPLRGFTLQWYRDLLQTPELIESVVNSLLLAVGSGVAATVLGTLAAIGLVRFRFVGAGSFSRLRPCRW
ncbi:MAG: hypothetical protein R2911_20870 [Caldilineaceae bacterium]